MTQETFEAEVIRLTPDLYRVSHALLLRLADRQDAVQNTILKAWQHKDRLRDESKFKTFLLKVLTNECRTLLRKTRREAFVPIPETGVSLPDASLREAVAALPPKLRAAFVLHYVEGASEVEIAYILNIPKGTVKSRLSRARLLLRQALLEEV